MAKFETLDRIHTYPYKVFKIISYHPYSRKLNGRNYQYFINYETVYYNLLGKFYLI